MIDIIPQRRPIVDLWLKAVMLERAMNAEEAAGAAWIETKAKATATTTLLGSNPLFFYYDVWGCVPESVALGRVDEAEGSHSVLTEWADLYCM